MKLENLYKKAIEIGIHNDLRKKQDIKTQLAEEKDKYNKFKDDEKDYYDKDKLFNPYADTRILNGSPSTEIKKVMLGIDIQIGEILLAHLLNKETTQNIDLIIGHHPEGHALAQLYDVMKLQSDLLAQYGVTISVAEQLMEKRIGEIERRLLPVNHTRAVDAARILGIPMMCIHTPSDNCVTSYLTKTFEKEKPSKLKDVMAIFRNIPEYKKASRAQVPPKIVSGSENSKCGKIFIDMTGGTSGSKDIFEKYASSGISTIIGMHLSEENLNNAKKANVNVIIAGHISSDTLGLNLLFDAVEKEEPLEFVSISGFERIRR